MGGGWNVFYIKPALALAPTLALTFTLTWSPEPNPNPDPNQWRFLAAVDWSRGQTPAELRRRLSGVLQRWRDGQPYGAPPTELRLSNVFCSWRDAAGVVESF